MSFLGLIEMILSESGLMELCSQNYAKNKIKCWLAIYIL